MKKKDSNRAIFCTPYYGPIFGNSNSSYECSSPLKSSLFVKTAGPDQQNDFKVSDYEVFTYN